MSPDSRVLRDSKTTQAAFAKMKVKTQRFRSWKTCPISRWLTGRYSEWVGPDLTTDNNKEPNRDKTRPELSMDLVEASRETKRADMEEGVAEHRRLILHNYLSPEECKEMEFIHNSCSTVGYRPNVFSTTLSHLIATNSPHLLIPFISIRERLKEKVEEFFGCEFELFIEFTGLISWCKGASIGWHSDDNRSYLKQRDFTAVCYLNSLGRDFNGGLFHFQDGEPRTVAPLAGDVIMYTADCKNVHSVDEVTDGERLTLTLWFSRDASHDEDTKLISSLCECLTHQPRRILESCLPLPASSNMYWFSPDQTNSQDLGFDVCVARLHLLGFDVYCSQEEGHLSDVSEQLMGPIQLAKGEELFTREFANILHALQVVMFYHWKASELQASDAKEEAVKETTAISRPQLERINALKSIFLHDQHLIATVLGCSSSKEKIKYSLDLSTLSTAIASWEEYTCKLSEELFSCLPHWKTQQTIYKLQCD